MEMFINAAMMLEIDSIYRGLSIRSLLARKSYTGIQMNVLLYPGIHIGPLFLNVFFSLINSINGLRLPSFRFNSIKVNSEFQC